MSSYTVLWKNSTIRQNWSPESDIKAIDGAEPEVGKSIHRHFRPQQRGFMAWEQFYDLREHTHTHLDMEYYYYSNSTP